MNRFTWIVIFTVAMTWAALEAVDDLQNQMISAQERTAVAANQ